MINATTRLKTWLLNAPYAWGGTWIDTVIIKHSTLQGGQFALANWWESDKYFTLETGARIPFSGWGLRVDLPGSGQNGKQDMTITIDNSEGTIWRALDAAQAVATEPIRVEWRVYLSDNDTQPQAQPYKLTATQVTATEKVITIVATRADLINRRWPDVYYRGNRWPGLVR